MVRLPDKVCPRLTWHEYSGSWKLTTWNFDSTRGLAQLEAYKDRTLTGKDHGVAVIADPALLYRRVYCDLNPRLASYCQRKSHKCTYHTCPRSQFDTHIMPYIYLSSSSLDTIFNDDHFLPGSPRTLPRSLHRTYASLLSNTAPLLNKNYKQEAIQTRNKWRRHQVLLIPAPPRTKLVHPPHRHLLRPVMGRLLQLAAI